MSLHFSRGSRAICRFWVNALPRCVRLEGRFRNLSLRRGRVHQNFLLCVTNKVVLIKIARMAIPTRSNWKRTVSKSLASGPAVLLLCAAPCEPYQPAQRQRGQSPKLFADKHLRLALKGRDIGPPRASGATSITPGAWRELVRIFFRKPRPARYAP